MLSAASTSATVGEDESEVISQPDSMCRIRVPMFETTVAIHGLRNSRRCCGVHADGGAR